MPAVARKNEPEQEIPFVLEHPVVPDETRIHLRSAEIPDETRVVLQSSTVSD
jgi:hypothetical protein